ncbi:MAG: hypothetical protein JSU83_17610, partial [Deltaproteobacteria bacterium]
LAKVPPLIKLNTVEPELKKENKICEAPRPKGWGFPERKLSVFYIRGRGIFFTARCRVVACQA